MLPQRAEPGDVSPPGLSHSRACCCSASHLRAVMATGCRFALQPLQTQAAAAAVISWRPTAKASSGVYMHAGWRYVCSAT